MLKIICLLYSISVFYCESYWRNWRLIRIWFLSRVRKSRSSLLEVFCKKGVLRNFAKFTGKYLCQSLFFNKQVFSCEFCKISENTLFYRTPPVWLLLKVSGKLTINIPLTLVHGVITHINQQKRIYFPKVREIIELLWGQPSDATSVMSVSKGL